MLIFYVDDVKVQQDYAQSQGCVKGNGQQQQEQKLRTIIKMSGITAEDHVLEIGCGWGSFAIEAARTTGCRVTGITISRQQLELARQRVREGGLEDKVTLKLLD